MARNDLVRRTQRIVQVYSDKTEAVMKGFMLDTAQITLHRFDGWGYDRLMRFTEQWGAIFTEFYPALNCDKPDSDVLQAHMDAIIRDEIIRGKGPFYPFAERYPDLKRASFKAKGER